LANVVDQQANYLVFMMPEGDSSGLCDGQESVGVHGAARTKADARLQLSHRRETVRYQ